MKCAIGEHIRDEIKSLERFRDSARQQGNTRMATRFSLLIHDFNQARDEHRKTCDECRKLNGVAA